MLYILIYKALLNLHYCRPLVFCVSIVIGSIFECRNQKTALYQMTIQYDHDVCWRTEETGQIWDRVVPRVMYNILGPP